MTHEHDDDALDRLARAWARAGVWLSDRPAEEPLDLEDLVVETAAHARREPRVFRCAATWLAQNHGLLNGQRLARMLEEKPPLVRATAGALLALARKHAGRATALDTALRSCRSISPPRPLFEVMERHPGLREIAEEDATDLFREWGLWHDDESLKESAIRPLGWILREAPELRARALLGLSLEAEMAARALRAPVTVQDVASSTGTSYAHSPETTFADGS